DQAIAATHDKHIILRTSWCFSSHGKNFARTMLDLAQTRDSLRVVSDQTGAPTSTDLLARVTADIVRGLDEDAARAGLYHLTAQGSTSWHGYAQLLFQLAED